MAITKQQRKFEKKHLGKALEKRKETKKIKLRHQNAEKKKVQKARDAVWTKGPDAGAKAGKEPKERKVNEMSVDDFFQGGFENIIDTKANGKKVKAKATDKGASTAATKKRKRDEPEDEEDASSSGEESTEEPIEAGSDSDDDEELEEAQGDDHGMTKQALQDLQKNDPGFYNFLKENDPEALDFDENDDLAGMDELSGSEAEGSDDDDKEDEQPKKKRKKEKKKKEKEALKKAKEAVDDRSLTCETVAKWRAAMEQTHSLRASRQVVIAFRCCAHLNEAGDDEQNQPRYKIESAEVFNDVVTLALKQIPAILAHHVPVKESASGKIYLSTDSNKFKGLGMMVKTYTAAVVSLLSTLSDAKTVNMTLQGLIPLTPYLLSFRKLLRVLVRAVVRFWCQPASAETTRLSAFLVLRRLVVIGDRTLRELVLKATYQGLIQGSRTTNYNTLAGINLMKNSAAELWGMDDSVGYTTGFNFIRQLAIHLRNSIVHNKNDAFRAVYNWQYVHSLDFWSCVLAEHCATAKISSGKHETQLKLLIYPLVQVTIGAMRLIPTSMYFPLRFHLVRSLLRISRATDTYIPLSSALLEVLDSAEMKRPPKPTTLRPLDFATAYKAPKSLLRTRAYQDGISDQVVALLGEYLVLWSTNISFPEFSLPTVIQLKRWLKLARRKGSSGGNKNQRMSSALAVLVQKIEATAKAVEQRRSAVDFAPKDRAKVEQFAREADWEKTPLGAYVLAQRRASDEKAKVMEEARRQDDQRRKEDEQAVDDEEEDDEEGEDDDEDDDDEGEEEDEDVEHDSE